MKRCFETGQLEQAHTGLLFLNQLMIELTTGSHLLGYYNYSLIISNFVRLLADVVFQQLLDSIVYCLAKKLDDELLKISCDSMFQLLLFPYENSYISFASD